MAVLLADFVCSSSAVFSRTAYEYSLTLAGLKPDLVLQVVPLLTRISAHIMPFGVDEIGLTIAIADIVCRLANKVAEHIRLVPENKSACEEFHSNLIILNNALRNNPTALESDSLQEMKTLMESITAKVEKHFARYTEQNRLSKIIHARSFATKIEAYRKRTIERAIICNLALSIGRQDSNVQERGILSELRSLQGDGLRAVRAVIELEYEDGSTEKWDIRREVRSGHDLSEITKTSGDFAISEDIIMELESRMPASQNPEEFALFQARTFDKLLQAIEGIHDEDDKRDLIADFTPWIISDNAHITLNVVECDSEQHQVIGSGDMGTVYAASYSENGACTRDVAVKVLNNHFSSGPFNGALYRQLYVHYALRNYEYFVELICANLPSCERAAQYRGLPENRVILVMERMEMDLPAAVEQKVVSSILSIVQILTDVAYGLLVLHTNNLGHFDLKPRHIFVNRCNGVLRAKLTDFAVISTLTQVPASYANHAPECLRTLGSDVWHMGAIILWLVSRFDTFTKHTNEFDVTTSSEQFNMIIDQKRTELSGAALELIDIASDCLKAEESERSNMRDIANRLSELKLNITEEIEDNSLVESLHAEGDYVATEN